ncbi:MAG: helix-turn-helix domain-containing protein, partial [Nitrososphaeria archaeon]
MNVTKIRLDETKNQLMSLLNLTEYEAKAYLTLLQHGALTIGELSKRSNIPRPKCYSVIRSLASKGICNIVPSKPMKCQPLDPKSVINMMIHVTENEISQKINNLKTLGEVLTRITSESEIGTLRMKPILTIIEGNDNIIKNLKADIALASNEILIAISNTPISFNWTLIFEDTIKAISKGAHFKYIMPYSEFFSKNVELIMGMLPSSLKDKVENWLKEGRVQLRRSSR